MMQAIVDSGASKADWVFVDGDEKTNIQTIGLSPFYIDAIGIKEELMRSIPEAFRRNTKAVYFYGAGCSSDARNSIVHHGITGALIHANVEVSHDLLGAARAGSLGEPGIVSILGTGSNSCVYDGTKITDNIPALGFYLGDEGSGAALGRALIAARNYREMPADLEKLFDERFNYDREDMLHNVYHQPLPSRYVAGFAPFCTEYRNTKFIQSLLYEVFTDFVRRHLIKYDRSDLACHFVGSIASAFQDELRHVLEQHNLTMGRCVKKPIDGLVEYHETYHAH